MSTGASSQTVIARLVEQLAGARVDEGAAAGRDHPHLALDQAGDQPPLAVAEIVLAIALEHLGGGQAGRVLDRGVAVDERQAEPPRQAPPDRRLSHSHQSDQHDRPVETLRQIHMLKGLYSGFPLGKSAAMSRDIMVLIILLVAHHRRAVLPVDAAQAAADPDHRGRRARSGGNAH